MVYRREMDLEVMWQITRYRGGSSRCKAVLQGRQGLRNKEHEWLHERFSWSKTFDFVEHLH